MYNTKSKGAIVMYTIFRAFSDVIYEIISAVSPKPVLWFDIDKNPYRLYLCAGRKLKKANVRTVCDSVIYSSEVFGKDIKKAFFANKNITEEGVKSIARLAKRVKTEHINVNNAFVIKELCKVTREFNDSAVEAVGEAIIRGVSFDEYMHKSGYNKHEFNIEPDAMWVVTHQVLNNVSADVIQKSVQRRSSYLEVVNSYLLESHSKDTSGVALLHKLYHNKDINMQNAGYMILKAIENGIDLTPFLNEKRILSVYNGCGSFLLRDVLDDVTDEHVSCESVTAFTVEYILNNILNARLSGVSEQTIIDFLRDREHMSISLFMKHLGDLQLLEQGVSL